MKTQVTVLLILCTILAVCDTHNLCNAENEGKIIQTQVKICHKGKPQTLFKIRKSLVKLYIFVLILYSILSCFTLYRTVSFIFVT